MIPNPKINFEAHKKLSDKFAFKLFFSLTWRDFLLQYLPAFIVIFTALGLIEEVESKQSFIFIISFSLLTYILITLLTNKYIINSLTRIKYKDFKVYLVKDNHILDKMGFYDCLCWRGSFFWRQLTLGLAFIIITMGIEYFQLLSESTINNISRGGQIGFQMAALFWVLKTKKTGALILLHPSKEL